MMQHQVTHPVGTFEKCMNCFREPKHFISRGKRHNEQMGGCNETHALECCPCGHSTGKHETLMAARAQWRSHYGFYKPKPFHVLKVKSK